MPLDLLVPHLLLAPDAPDELRSLRLPALEKWAARGDADAHPATNADAWLAAEHGLPPHAPFAAVALASDLPDAAGEWLRADPVHLRIEGDGLFLHSAAVAPPSAGEARALVDTLQAHFAEDGVQFHIAAPDRWYVHVPDGESPVTTPLVEALGRNMFGLLPEARGRIRWRSALTEAQMVLSDHAVNTARERSRRPAINSVWFWGEGARPASIARRYHTVHADDPYARGLGLLSGAGVHGAPRSLRDLPEVRGNDVSLAVIDTLSPAALRADEDAWRAAAQALDADLAAMPALIDRFERVRIVMPSRHGTRIATLTPGSRWRIFRAARPLSADA